jgi:hypothetical protein
MDAQQFKVRVQYIWECPNPICRKMALRKTNKNQSGLCCNHCLTIIDLDGQIVGSAGNEAGQKLMRKLAA